MKRFSASILLLSGILLSSESKGQYLRAKVGTDIPMQYLFGINYQQGKYASAEMTLGYVGIPYNGDLYKVINVPEHQEAKKEYLIETTDDGFVWGMGVNGHYKKWYGGVFFQRLELHASASYKYILGSDLFQEELNEDQKILLNTFLDEGANLGAFSGEIDLNDVIRLNMVTWQGGLKIGRRFFFKNPRWEFRAEFAFSKNLTAQITSDYDNTLFDDIKSQYKILQSIGNSNPEFITELEERYGVKIPLNQDLDALLNFDEREEDLEDWFHEYGYIPTLNFHLTYLIFVPKKVKVAQPEPGK